MRPAEPAQVVIRGRIATLAGATGFGWVDALAIGGGRVLAAGTAAEMEPLVGPRTRRLDLAPDEVAIPGLTDAHLHVAEAALALDRVDLEGAPTLDAGLVAIGAAHAALAEPDAWLEGHGWDHDRWAGWPSAPALERVAPGRRVALWAHDHHALWVSERALREAEVDAATVDPAGGFIARDAAGRPTGILHETATRLVTTRVPRAEPDALAAAIERLGRHLVALGVVAAHDPGSTSPDADAISHPVFAGLADAGRLPIRVHAGFRPEAFERMVAAGRRSGAVLGEDPSGRARLGWQKLFADGTLGSRTAALLAPFEAEAPGPVSTSGADDGQRGLWVTPPGELVALAAAAAEVGIATQIHAIGDRAARAALDALEPTVARVPLMPRVEHVQLLDAADRGRFAAGGIAASVQPIHLRSDADAARRLWGERAERLGYAWGSLAATGAVIAFGTDAPVEPIDPWPGIALAVIRLDATWPPGSAPFGPGEALDLARALRAACVDPAVTAAELDRGRLVAGQRADLVILAAAALAEPVGPGGALAMARPRRVLMDGEVVFEA